MFRDLDSAVNDRSFRKDLVLSPERVSYPSSAAPRISIAFDAKRLGTQVRTMTVQANFSDQASCGSNGTVAYETMLLDSMRGDATRFTRRDEVEQKGASSRRLKTLPTPSVPGYVSIEFE
jgi:glucose-6-phosphate 1-dehydrogenase